MSEQSERRIGDLIVRIDRDLCVGFGECMAVAPKLFEFDDEGIAAFIEDAPDPGRETVIEACEACPVDALGVLDENGRRLVP